MLSKMHQRGRRARAMAAAVAEALETRRLLAGIEAGVLVARGTAGNDLISVRRTGTDDVIVTTNGINQTFDMDNFTGVRLEGLGGDDRFNLIDPLVSRLVRDTTVVGGGGRDTVDYSARTAALEFNGYFEPPSDTDMPYAQITSGAQTDRVEGDVEAFIGGSGDDTLGIQDESELANTYPLPAAQTTLLFDGRGGNNYFASPIGLAATLLGGAGNDQFEVYENARDTILAGAGNDRIVFFNEGLPNRLDAGSGTDTAEVGSTHLTTFLDMRLYAGLEDMTGVGIGSVRHVIGNDLNNVIIAPTADQSVTLEGLGGNDTLLGGDLGDSLVGGFGDDSINGGNGTDTVDGGPGNDTIVNAEVQPGPGSIGRVGRTLIADGSWGEDLITIERTGADDVIVRVNDTSRTFDMDDFDAVILRGNGGFDELRVLQPLVAGSLVRPITLLGGSGADTLLGSDGSSNELLDGGEGDDFLDTHDGFGGDTAIGGNGTDSAVVDATDTASGIENFN